MLESSHTYFRCSTLLKGDEFALFYDKVKELFELTNLFEEESFDGSCCFGGLVAKSEIPLLNNLSEVSSLELIELDHGIDWEEQWAQSQYFCSEQRLLNIPLMDFSCPLDCSILLKPGPGFGDLLHPSTQLILNQLCNFHNWKGCVIDIGTGSGVLALAASKMKIINVLGIDIDNQALIHANNNQALNNTNAIFSSSISEAKDFLLSSPTLCLMNMISSEQTLAWQQCTPLHSCNGYVITSGILEEELDSYLKDCKARGWFFKSMTKDYPWVSCLFSF
jgi:ribosomal protein L11 methyltransferase